MVMTDRAEVKRLVLQIERDVLAQAHLRALLTAAGTTVTGHRQDLRAVEARIARARGAHAMRAPR